MKLWLNHILACPDDKSFPFAIKIFKWESSKDEFTELLNGFEQRSLINFKDPKDPLKIQNLKDDNSQEKVLSSNKKMSLDKSYQKIINFIRDKGSIQIQDSNKVNPCSIEEYLEFYFELMGELENVQEASPNSNYQLALKLVKDQIFKTMRDFASNLKQNPIVFESIEKIIEYIEPIFQELLFLNYYFFNMEIEEGILICPECSGLFPIINTIPRLLPKNMEKTEIDTDFYEKWKDFIPKDLS